MKDLLNLTDTELIEMFVNNPDELDQLVKESKLELKELAEVFVKQPFLQKSILKYNDPTELYNFVSEKINSKGNMKDEEYNNLMYALKNIKKYVLGNPEYNKKPIADTLRGISVEIEDEPRGTSLISRAEHDELIRLGLDEIEIMDLPNYSNRMIVSLLERCPGSYFPISIALEKHGILLDNQELINELVYRIENPYFDPDYGEEEVEGYKRVLEEMGTSYEEIKDYEREDFKDYDLVIDSDTKEEIDDANIESNTKNNRDPIPLELLEWLNGDAPETPLQQKEKELSLLEEQEARLDKKIKDLETKDQDIGGK